MNPNTAGRVTIACDRLRTPPGHGRPRGDAASNVPQRIFEAAQRIIENRGHFVVTDKEIAAEAGVSVAMINYYYESKDGLLFALVDRLCIELEGVLREAELRSKTGSAGNRRVTRDVFGILVRAYHSRPAISRIMISEMARENSIVRLRFINRYGARAMESLKRVFDNFVACGIYDRLVDTDHAAFALISLLNAPLLITRPIRASNRPVGPGCGDQETERWIDYLADMFDRQFAVSAAC